MIKSVKLLVIISLFFLYLNISAVSAVDVYLGESVVLRGSCTSDYVYLFVTGPNLPSNGANPDNIYEAVVTGDESSFVRVSAFNNRWSYSWDTRTSQGTPDAGTYTIYAVEKPVGRYDLSGAEYSTLTVKLLDPTLSVSEVSSSESSEYSLSSDTQELTESPTISETEEITPDATTVAVKENTTETPSAGISPYVLILSLVMSLFFVMIPRKMD